mmetsp:Transcript_46665/g.107091  ORF Transcript_46665/g.107091 Transcript_46665/m.107091 type:complete len:565 (-) Transcript_46665:651-2345(-)
MLRRPSASVVSASPARAPSVASGDDPAAEQLAAAVEPVKKWMTVTSLSGVVRKISWYDPSPQSALDQLLRAAFRLAPERQYMLTDSECLPVALSSSLPSGHTFELVPVHIAAASSPPIAVVVVDPISTGAVLAHHLVNKRGYEVVAVWSEVVPDELKAFVAHGMDVTFAGRVQHVAGKVAATAAAVRAINVQVIDVIVGCETGVLLGDELSEALGVRTNGTKMSGLRRNKFQQTEAVRKAGLNACSQMLAVTMDDVERFLLQPKPTPFKAVVKPVEGAGSDGVSICYSEQEVRNCFKALQGTQNVLGLTNKEVLLQEYLSGDEYVVDTVSRNGVHKCVAIWKYDKRRYNDAPFVYFGMRFMPIEEEPHLQAMVEYIFRVLDSLGIKCGCMHSEVKQETRGPVLIEVNCRMHGGEGTWAPMAEACVGYSAVSACADCFTDPAAFAALPPVPTNFKNHAMEAKLRSDVEGILTAIDEAKLSQIRALRSFSTEMLTFAIGKEIFKTIDAVTACGNINLINPDPAQLLADYAALHELVGQGIFTASPLPPRVPSASLSEMKLADAEVE